MIRMVATSTELMVAAIGGGVRRITGVQDRLNKNKHAEKSDWATDIDGTLSEMMFAKWRGTYYMPENRSFKKPDVGGYYHVRSTSYVSGCLILRRNDAECAHLPFILAVTDPPVVMLIGWRYARECMVDEFWREDKNAWWVPQGSLRDMNDLPEPPEFITSLEA
jgi:hypothetical protein